MTKSPRTLVEFHIDYQVTMPQCGTVEFSELLDAWIEDTRYVDADMKPCGGSQAEDIMDELANTELVLDDNMEPTPESVERYEVNLCQHLALWVVEAYAAGNPPNHAALRAVHYHDGVQNIEE
jgi:hypothetical protein